MEVIVAVAGPLFCTGKVRFRKFVVRAPADSWQAGVGVTVGGRVAVAVRVLVGGGGRVAVLVAVRVAGTVGVLVGPAVRVGVGGREGVAVSDGAGVHVRVGGGAVLVG